MRAYVEAQLFYKCKYFKIKISQKIRRFNLAEIIFK